MHMLSRKVLNSADLDAVRVSTRPATVSTANRAVDTHEEAIMYVKDLDLFVTAERLQNTRHSCRLVNSAKIMGIPTSALRV